MVLKSFVLPGAVGRQSVGRLAIGGQV